MTQESERVSLSQTIMNKKLKEIATWMRGYEQQRYNEVRKKDNLPPKELPESEKTQILSSPGYCFGLSALLIHSAITEDQIEYKKLHGLTPNQNPYTVDRFYERLSEINSCTIPKGNEKEFYEKMNVFMFELLQVMAYDGKAFRRIDGVAQNMEMILNEASNIEGLQDDRKKKLHTYFFTNNKQLLEWGQKAVPGNTLCVLSDQHATVVYIKKNSNGEPIVGFYDPNNTTRMEILQGELKDVSQIESFQPFRDFYKAENNHAPAVCLCEHIISENHRTRDIGAPQIADSVLNSTQRLYALQASKKQLRPEINKCFLRLYKDQIALASAGDKEAVKELFDAEVQFAIPSKYAGITAKDYIEPRITAAINSKDPDLPTILINWYLRDPKYYKDEGLDIESYKQQFFELSTKDNDLGQVMMCLAFKEGNKDAVEALRQKGVSLNSKDQDSSTPCYWAAITGQADMIDLLIANKVDLNSQGVGGKTPLMVAEDPSIQAKLICASAAIKPESLKKFVELYDKYPETGPYLMYYAALHTDSESIKMLCSKGIDIYNGVDSNTTRLLFNSARSNPDILNKAGLDAQQYINSCITKDASIAAMLVNECTSNSLAFKNAGVDLGMYRKQLVELSTKDNDLGKAMILWAAKEGDKGIVEELIQKGIDVNSKGELSNTPLHWAASRNHKEILDLLVRSNADLTIRSSMGTPLYVALIIDNIDCAIILMKAGGVIKPDMLQGCIEYDAIYNKHPETRPIFMKHAIDYNDANSIKALQQRGMDINAVCANDMTPLQYAAMQGKEAAAISLIDLGAAIPVGSTLTNLMEISKNSHELARSMLFYAAKNNNPEMLSELLKTTKCDVLALDDKKCTALDCAKAKNNTDIVAILESIVAAKLAAPVKQELHIANAEHVSRPSSTSAKRSAADLAI